jgi:hypothetical protein
MNNFFLACTYPSFRSCFYFYSTFFYTHATLFKDLLYNNLAASSSLIGLVISCITGCNTITLMKNPLFSSTSPSDFWGGRWNLIVHGLLKRGRFSYPCPFPWPREITLQYFIFRCIYSHS